MFHNQMRFDNKIENIYRNISFKNKTIFIYIYIYIAMETTIFIIVNGFESFKPS